MHRWATVVAAVLVLMIQYSDVIASTASPYPVNYIQPDGTALSITVKGDEHLKWAVTSDGYTVLLNGQGFYEYGTAASDGALVLSGIRAHDAVQRTPAEADFLRQIPMGLSFNYVQTGRARALKTHMLKAAGANAFPTTGSRKLLLIMIAFTDKAFTKTQADFDSLMNKTGYSAGGATGSVKDFYLDNSFSQLSLDVTVAGPYTAAHPISYYGANDSYGNDVNPEALIKEALALANPDVNYADYDNDGDGTVDGVYVIYAGYGEEAGASANTIWAHASSLSPAVTLDGKTISSYSTSCELYGTSGTTLTGVGVVCHEFGHVLGLPDFYDTDYASSGGQSFDPDAWDPMAGGSWNNAGKTPAYHNCYSRTLLHWQTSTVLNSAASITMPNAAQNNVSYRFNTSTSNEFFMMENRQQIKWDAYIPGHGLIIYHVDKNYGGWSSNCGNCVPTHQAFDIEEADNVRTDATRSGDVFPGTSGITSFTDATTPGAKSWAGANSLCPLTNIAENATSKIITFSVMQAPPSLTTTGVTGITTSAAASGGNISNDGGSSVTARGVCWNTSGTPTTAGSKTSDGSGTETFTSSLTGLTAGTTYYVRAYAANANGTAYGNQVTFTTTSSGGGGGGSSIVLLDNFDRTDNTAIGTAAVGANSLPWVKGSETAAGRISITGNMLQMMSGSPAGREWAYVDMGSISGYPATLSSASSTITWAFNMKQSRTDPSGFAAGNYGMAFVLAASGTDWTTANGYAVGFGNSGSTDYLKLFSFTGGLGTSSAIITGSTDLGAEYISVRVTYEPATSTWSLYAESSTTAFPQTDPRNEATAAGAPAANSSYTGTSLRYLGGLWNHSTGASDKALFDDLYVTNPETGLPVELTSFSASPKKSAVLLRWSTASETNSHGFNIERNDGSIETCWRKIGFVPAAGSSSIPLTYSFTDAAAAGKYLYRLKQVDRDGRFEYSSVVETEITAPPAAFGVMQNYPNPFNPSTRIRFTLDKTGKARLTVFNLLGQQAAVLFDGMAESGKEYAATFDASSLAAGMYIYRLETASRIDVRKMQLLK